MKNNLGHIKGLLVILLFFGSTEVNGQCTPPITLDSGYPVIVNPDCDDNTGSIEVQASGNGLIRYSLNGGAFSTNGLFTGLGPGNYTIRMRDGTGCTQSINIPLQGASSVAITNVTSTAASCLADDGSITVSATGTGLEYSIDGTNYQPGNVFNNLPSGAYTVTVRDSNGCNDSQGTTVARSGIQIVSESHTNTSCGTSNGSITVVATGSGTVQYSIDGTNWQNNGNFTGLAIGNYTIRIRDGSGCTRNVNEPVGNSLQYTLSHTNATCGQNDGTITVTVTSPGTYSFSINGGAYQSSNTFNNLAPANYTIRIRDDVHGCVVRTRRRVSENLTITNVAVVTTPTVCGGATGTITATATGSGLTYSIDGGTTTFPAGVFTGLTAGNYTVQIADNGGCVINEPATVSEANTVTINSITPTQSSCTGSTGSIMVNATGVAPLEYDIGSGFQLSNTFTGLPTGPYTVTVRDAGTCIQTQNTYVSENNDIGVTSVSVTAPTTACSADGQITVVANGTNVEYSIDNVLFGPSGTFTGLNAGFYIIYMRNSLGCTKQTGQIELVGEILITGFTIVEPTCNLSNGEINITGTGDGLEFSLDNVDYFQSGSFTNLPSGPYTTYIRDEDNCIVRRDTVLVSSGGVNISNVTSTTTSCGDANGTIDIFATTQATTLDYSIDGVNYFPNSQFTNVASGTYDAIARDDIGCTDTTTVTVGQSFPLYIDSVALKENVCAFTNGRIEVIASGGTAFREFSLDGVGYQSQNVFGNLADGPYTVYVRDSVDCVVTRDVEVPWRCEVHVPTAITVNNNGQNDLLKLLYYIPLQVNDFHVFDRWGTLVYKNSDFMSSDDSAWWDGRGKEDKIIPGLYFYRIKYELNGPKSVSGSVTVLN